MRDFADFVREHPRVAAGLLLVYGKKKDNLLFNIYECASAAGGRAHSNRSQVHFSLDACMQV